MIALRQRWERFWFLPEAPDNLGLCRILYFGLLVLLYARVDFSAWGDVSRFFWFPIALFRWLGLPVLDVSGLAIVAVAWKVALFASALGVVTRASTLVAFVLGTYLLGLPHNFGKVSHYDAIVVLVLGVMAFSSCGDAWSLDRALGRARARAPVEPSGEYRWPVRAVWLTLSLVFFAAGVSKLRHSGLAWVTSDNLSVLLLRNAYRMAHSDPLPGWGVWLAGFPLLCKALAFATIVIELGYPSTLFSRRARWFFAPAACAMLVGIRLFLGPRFPEFVLCHVFWIRWDRVVGALGVFLDRRDRGGSLARVDGS